ncbi:hypothetical protein THOM_2764, partial [Trachipleistophora hominis]
VFMDNMVVSFCFVLRERFDLSLLFTIPTSHVTELTMSRLSIHRQKYNSVYFISR